MPFLPIRAASSFLYQIMFNKLRTPCGNICYNLFQVLHIALRIKGSAETSKGIRLSLTTVFAKIVKAAVIESPISAQTFSMFFFISLPGIHNSTKTPMFSGFLAFLLLFPFNKYTEIWGFLEYFWWFFGLFCALCICLICVCLYFVIKLLSRGRQAHIYLQLKSRDMTRLAGARLALEPIFDVILFLRPIFQETWTGLISPAFQFLQRQNLHPQLSGHRHPLESPLPKWEDFFVPYIRVFFCVDPLRRIEKTEALDKPIQQIEFLRELPFNDFL